MNLRSLIVFFCLLNTLPFPAQIEPAENAVLHSTQVYCQEEFVPGAKKYKLLLMDSTDRTTVYTTFNHVPAFWRSDLQWGHVYQWQIKAFDSIDTEINAGNFHRFRIQEIQFQRIAEVQLSVRKNETDKHAGGFIAIDYSRSIFSRSGVPVWTVPVKDTLMDTRIQVRDLKLTRQNTLTFLTGRAPLEIDLDGNVLWSAPYPYYFEKDSITYHHEFQKTSRGTYLVLGFRRVYRKVLGNVPVDNFEKDSELKVIGNVLYRAAQMSVLLEFNRKGELVWFWDSNSHISDDDLNFKKTPKGVPNFATHANAFSENKAGTKVYVGFRDLNRIVKVDKKTKRVELSYGEKYPSGHGKVGQQSFKRQHGALVTDHNTILVFNNNSMLKDSAVAAVIELKDPALPTENPVVWKLSLDFDSIKGKAVSGGNVTELPNKNLLVCAGTFNRLFEVTRSKNVVWDAFLFSRGIGDIYWQPAPQYRCSWVKALNRYRFMVQVSPAQSKAAQKSVRVTIYNTGNTSDKYQVDLVNKTGKIITRVQSAEVSAGAQIVKTLSYISTATAEELTMVIRSLNSTVQHSQVLGEK